jgi:phage tail-like protein
MDANQTRFHLLLGEPDWARCTGPAGAPAFGVPGAALSWDQARHEVTLQPKLLQFVPAPGHVQPDLGSRAGNDGDRRGAARDRFGNWYYISLDRLEILVCSAGCQETTHFWSTSDVRVAGAPANNGPFQPTEALKISPPAALSGLAVTEDHYLVAGTLAPKGLLIFDLYAGGPPQQLCWPEAIPFVPFDMAPRPGGGVWILDRANARYWGLDRHLRVLVQDQLQIDLAPAKPAVFQASGGPPSGPTAPKPFPAGIWLEEGSPVAAADPIAIEALPDGTVLILDSNPGQPFSRVFHYRFGDVLGNPVLPDSMRNLVEESNQFRLRAYDFAFLAGQQDPPTAGRLCFATEEGTQSFIFTARFAGDQLQLEPVRDYLPMRLFTGMGLVSADGSLFYDSNRQWVPLVPQPRSRYETAGTLWTPTPLFDGRDPQCVWHRFLLDACIPPETQVEVWSRAADSQQDALRAAWFPEPSLYRRSTGSELPFTPAPSSLDRGTFELLFQSARGRYLQLQLRLTGNGNSSPRLRALRLYYPRFSYLTHYLPRVYREDAVSASFLDRFLANIEGTNTGIEDRIAAVQMLFDVRSAPADTLEWLASWFGIALDPAWDERRQRLFIGHAMEFFQWRCTPRGLRMAVQLVFDQKPDATIFAPPGAESRAAGQYRIVEKFALRRNPGISPADSAAASIGPRQVSPTGRWLPSMGVAELQRRYQLAPGNKDAVFGIEPVNDPFETASRAAFALRELGFVPSDSSDDLAAWRNFLRSRYQNIDQFNRDNGEAYSDFDVIPLPADRPASDMLRNDWSACQTATSAQPYGMKRQMWQDFLSRRYSGVQALNLAYATHWDSFGTVAYPASLPGDGPPLRDWFDFESVVLPTLASAHQFSVLLPFTGQTLTSVETRQQKLQLAQRVIELEKPAHTTFDVKFYWALFRLGEARLGSDTVLGLGGRDPALLPAAVLGQTYLSETYLAPGYPFDATARQIVGRDRIPGDNTGNDAAPV